MQISLILTVFSLAVGGASDATTSARAALSYLLAQRSVSDISAGRRVVLAHHSSTLAMQAAFPKDSFPFEGLIAGKPATDSEFDQVAVCERRPSKQCRLPQDVIFIRLTSTERRSASAVVIRVDYAYSVGDAPMSSRSMKLLVERIEGDWRVIKVLSGAVG